MPLTLSMHTATRIPVEVPDVLPSRCREASLDRIRRMPIFHGNEQLQLADLFDIGGDPSDGTVVWDGDLSGVHRIGQRMDSGQMRVVGAAGRHLGNEMTGGRIDVDGSTGDWLGSQMHGGQIHVHGDAGNLVGAAYRGSTRGMTGGAILVDGTVGDEVGHSMRRGLIVVGAAGEAVGARMIAGTVLVMGDCGSSPGGDMRRGTLGLFAAEPPPLLPTFRYGCRCRPVILRTLFRHLRELGYSVDDRLLRSDFALHHGDLLAGGRGEVFVLSC